MGFPGEYMVPPILLRGKRQARDKRRQLASTRIVTLYAVLSSGDSQRGVCPSYVIDIDIDSRWTYMLQTYRFRISVKVSLCKPFILPAHNRVCVSLHR